MAHPELADWYSSMADLYERKLWHQLTQKLDQFVALAVFQVCHVPFSMRGCEFCGARNHQS